MRLNLRPGSQAWRLTRSGNINQNPTTVEQRAGAFAGGASQHRSATVIVTRNDDGLDHYVTMPSSPRADSAALNLAHTVAAHIEKTDDLPDLSAAPHVVYLKYLPTETGTSNTQAGIDITEVSRIMGDAMPAGSWVAATMRAPRFGERSRWAAWLAYRTGTRRPTHHSTATRARVMTMWAGANTRDEAEMVLDTVSSALPGFDLRTRPQPPARWSLAGSLIAAALILGVATVFTPMTDFTADYIPTKFLWLGGPLDPATGTRAPIHLRRRAVSAADLLAAAGCGRTLGQDHPPVHQVDPAAPGARQDERGGCGRGARIGLGPGELPGAGRGPLAGLRRPDAAGWRAGPRGR